MAATYYDESPPPSGTFVMPPGGRLATEAESFNSTTQLTQGGEQLTTAAGATLMYTNTNVPVWVVLPPTTAGTINTGVNTNGTSSGTKNLLSAITPIGSGTTIREMAQEPVDPAINPLHQFASYTYNVSLWKLSLQDFNRLMASVDVGAAMNFNPTRFAGDIETASFVLAEDSGIYPDRRVPNTLGVNYNIQSVEFTTYIGLSKTYKSTNAITGKMQIVEPYGCTFVDSIIEASWNGKQYINHTQQPYMLQIDFKGYDDVGNEIPASQTAIYRKRFPIKILSIKIDVNKQGSSYDLSFAPCGAMGHYPEHGTIPSDVSITAKTVNDFFKQLSTKITEENIKLVSPGGKARYADSIKFIFDDKIGNSNIADSTQIEFGKGDPATKNISFEKKTFHLPAGTAISDIITRIIAQSDYFTIDQNIGPPDLKRVQANKVQNLATILKMFKTLSEVQYIGTNIDKSTEAYVWDDRRNTLPVQITYKIHQYAVWQAPHPATNSQLADARPFKVRNYNYLYTGQNIDILDFKLDFKSTYYAAMLAYPYLEASNIISKNTVSNEQILNIETPIINTMVLGKAIPQFLTTPNVTQLRYKPETSNPTVTAIGSSPRAQIGADVVRSMYSGFNGDMLQINLKIVGDPVLIKQDDWLYVPDPNKSTEYIGTDSMNQDRFSSKNGHIRTDTGEVVVGVKVNSPIDVDLDIPGGIGNQGLAFPQPNTYQSLFSGEYRILQIKSTFINGKFEQDLKMARYINSSLISAFTDNRDAVKNAIQNGANSGVNSNGQNVSIPLANGLFRNPEDGSVSARTAP